MTVSNWVYIIGILLTVLVGCLYIRMEIRRRDELAFVVKHLSPLLQDFFAWGPKVEREGDVLAIPRTKSSRSICASPRLFFGDAAKKDMERFAAVRTLLIDAEVRADEESERVVRIEVYAHTTRSKGWIVIGYELITPPGFVLPKSSTVPYLQNDQALHDLVCRARKYLVRAQASTD